MKEPIQHVAAQSCSRRGRPDGEQQIEEMMKEPIQQVAAQSCSRRDRPDGELQIEEMMKESIQQVAAQSCSRRDRPDGEQQIEEMMKEPIQQVAAQLSPPPGQARRKRTIALIMNQMASDSPTSEPHFMPSVQPYELLGYDAARCHVHGVPSLDDDDVDCLAEEILVLVYSI